MSELWVDQIVVHWLDRYGRDWSTRYTLQDQSGFDLSPYNAFLGALQNASDAKIIRAIVSRVETYGGVLGSGPYDSVREHALLQCVSLDNQAIRLRIAGPKSAIFTGDDETVDIADPLIVAVETEASAVVSSLTFSALATIKKGRRVQVMR